jgi:hypothetical protein
MPATLATARQEFIEHMYRSNTVSERPRLLAVLDAMIAWSAARPELVRFLPDDNTKGAIRFEEATTHTVFWMATPRRDNTPLLQLLPGSSRRLSDDERSEAIARLNARTREENTADRMHIGFGALKSLEGRTVVFELMDELLEKLRRKAAGVTSEVAAVATHQA